MYINYADLLPDDQVTLLKDFGSDVAHVLALNDSQVVVIAATPDGNNVEITFTITTPLDGSHGMTVYQLAQEFENLVANTSSTLYAPTRLVTSQVNPVFGVQVVDGPSSSKSKVPVGLVVGPIFGILGFIGLVIGAIYLRAFIKQKRINSQLKSRSLDDTIGPSSSTTELSPHSTSSSQAEQSVTIGSKPKPKTHRKAPSTQPPKKGHIKTTSVQIPTTASGQHIPVHKRSTTTMMAERGMNIHGGPLKLQPTAQTQTWGQWSKSYDATTNCFYYFNAQTGQSSWDKPPGFP